MSFAALHVPRFALLAVLRAEPGLAGRPVALVAGDGRRAVVLEASPAAARATPGLAVPLAAARCPGLVMRERDPAAEQEAQRLLVAAGFTLSPRVESTAPGDCTVDLQGADAARTTAALHRAILELRALGLPPGGGLAATPLLARLAARHADPVRVVDDRDAFLRPLPLALADPTPAQAEVLAHWGVRTLGELTALPKGEVGRRLGPGGVALWERARGDSPPVLRLTVPAQSFAAAWVYEPPVESAEPLLFKLQRYAERVALELRAAGLAAAALALTLELEDETEYRREFRLPEPGTDVAAWLRVLQSHLDTVRLAARVAGVRLAATPARAAVRQDGLFDTGLSDPPAFWENLARLAALVGDDRVGTPAPVDRHAPDAFQLERPAVTVAAPAPPPCHAPRGGVLRRFRPAWAVRVECDTVGPVALGGPVRGPLRDRRGPWHLSGDWWQPAAWAVEQWHVELADGGLYQLSRNHAGWWLDGELD